MIKPIVILPNVIELTYYSNTLVAHYALESSIAVAIEVMDKSSGSLIHQDLMSTVLELVNIMQYEFLLCKPCQVMEQIVTGCIDDLVYRKQIFLMVSNLRLFILYMDQATDWSEKTVLRIF